MTESDKMFTYLKGKFDYFLEEEIIQEMSKVGVVKDVPADTILMEPGSPITMLPLVIEGSLKISRENENGEELLLYYLEGGETCAMTIQCCVRNKKSEIKAITLEDSKLLFVPIDYMQVWMSKYNSWREFVLGAYHLKMMELIETVDALAFMNLDQRLMKYLSDQAKLAGSLEINKTHQEIAEDLHSSRVVISRLLKSLENKGELKIGRNKVILRSI